MFPMPGLARMVWLMAFTIAGLSGKAGDTEILTRLGDYFKTKDLAGQQEIVAAIEADPAFNHHMVSAQLHKLELWPQQKPGRGQLGVNVGFGHGRRIAMRYPKGYTPEKAWPLIYALHSSGGSGAWYLENVVKVLGKKADDYVIAAPSNYRQTSIDAPPPFTAEHPIMIQAIRRWAHVDSNRIYAMGRSLGGYTAWIMAIMHPDIFASSIPISSCMGPNDADGLWEALFPNFAHLPILHIWGSRDSFPVVGLLAERHNIGGMSDLNRALSPLIRKYKLNVNDHSVTGGSHGNYRLPKDKIYQYLTKKRVANPKKVDHTYRHLHQGRSYWLEVDSWKGPRWDNPRMKISTKKGESWSKAAGRIILPLLGRLQGEIKGQTITVSGQNVGDMIVWFGKETVDWNLPVKIIRDNKTVFEGKLERDLGVALHHVAIGGDFERLRWAGIRIDASGKAEVVKIKEAAPLWGRKLMDNPVTH